MISVIDGTLYQWDTGRKVKIEAIEGFNIDEVHFSHYDGQTALIVKPDTIDEGIAANIPNVLLQQSKSIICYVVMYNTDGEQTITDHTFSVIPRSKPADYVYTETELYDYKRIAEGYEQNVHYEQTTKEVMEILHPLSDNLQYMTYRKRSLFSSANSNEGGIFYSDDPMQIRFPMDTGPSIVDPSIIDKVNMSDTLELDMNFYFGGYYAYGVPVKQKIRMNLNTIAINRSSHDTPYTVAGIIQFSESIKDVDSVYYMEDGDEKNSIIAALLSPIPILIDVMDGFLLFTFQNSAVFSIIMADCIENNNSWCYMEVELYKIEYYTPQEISDALDKLNGEVI